MGRGENERGEQKEWEKRLRAGEKVEMEDKTELKGKKEKRRHIHEIKGREKIRERAPSEQSYL